MFCLKHVIEDLIEKKVIFTPPTNHPNVTKNLLPNHHTIPPARNANLLEVGGEFDPFVLITQVGHPIPAYHIQEDDCVCIIRGTEDIWLEGGEEEKEFEQDTAEEIVALEW